VTAYAALTGRRRLAARMGGMDSYAAMPFALACLTAAALAQAPTAHHVVVRALFA
jgi:hypothetical protein